VSNLDCPQCGQVDKVQKVSALFTQGTSHTTYETPSGAVQINDTTFYATRERTATSQTALSRKLGRPAYPGMARPDRDHYFSTGGNRLYVIIVLFIIGLAGFIGALNNTELSSRNGWPLFYCLGPILCIYFPFLYLQGNSRVKKYGKQAYEAKMGEYNTAMAHYRTAEERWDSAYYCGRCDGVFIPGSGRFAPIESFRSLLYG
jgi:hypothetical protein